MPSLVILVLVSGALIGAGMWTIYAGTRVPVIRLSDALAALSDEPPLTVKLNNPLVLDENSRLERFGAWLYTRSRVPLRPQTAARLSLQGRSIGDFYVAKALFTFAGLIFPLLIVWLIFGTLNALQLPLLIGLIGAVLGWFLPDLQLRNQHEATRSDAASLIHVYIDLVILERLANRSAVQALTSAAGLSSAPIMQRIRAALTRARLQQRPPWRDFDELATELELPQLADLVDVMRLDEQGASLVDSLASRVKELRDAQLTYEKQLAHETSERMTVWMALPVLVFALAFITPPLLQMAGVR